MNKQEIQALDDKRLWAIVRSTSTSGNFWLELSYAKAELQRRANAAGKHLVGL